MLDDITKWGSNTSIGIKPIKSIRNPITFSQKFDRNCELY